MKRLSDLKSYMEPNLLNNAKLSVTNYHIDYNIDSQRERFIL